MELATQPLRDKTNTVIMTPVMDNSIKFMPLVKPLDSRLRPELVGVWNSPCGLSRRGPETCRICIIWRLGMPIPGVRAGY